MQSNTPITDKLRSMPPTQRWEYINSRDSFTRKQLFKAIENELGNFNYFFQDDPIGFCKYILGENLWSKQKEICESVVNNKRTAIKSTHASGKSHTMSRLVVWWGSVWPPGTVKIVSTAPTDRQVRTVLWPEIRKLIKKAKLPGECFTKEWQDENKAQIAFGFSAADHDESAVQGIHHPNLLIVVDEAGGIGHTLGKALEAITNGPNTKLVIVGNPPTDEPNSWFEKACSSANYNTIKISAYDTPNFTNEKVDWCSSCPPGTAPHLLSDHLTSIEWVEDVINEFGEESPWVIARVHAEFPQSSFSRVIPSRWVEYSLLNEDPAEGNFVKLGIDIAADGGDELVIALADGFTASILLAESGSANANAMDVAVRILEHINQAEYLAKEKEAEKVRVKIDPIGVGWGVVSILQKMKEDGRHDSIIIHVNVSESARDSGKFKNIRAELWWLGRELLSTNPKQQLKLAIDDRTANQISAVSYLSDSAGRIQIESKKDIKRNKNYSPDRAEAILLAYYEPKVASTHHILPISIQQTNRFSI